MPDSFFVDARGRLLRRPSDPNRPASLVETPVVSLSLTSEERAAIQALPSTDPVRAALQLADASSPSGMGTVTAPASTALSVAASTTYAPYTVSGPTTFTVSGAGLGAQSSIMVVADGSNVPAISGADEWASSFPYVNTAGVPNRLDVWYDGVAARYVWSRALIPVAAPPAPTPSPPAPTPPAPTPPAPSPTPPAPPPSGGEDALTTAWRSAMATAGRTVNETHAGYADTFAKGLRSAGLHTKPILVVLGIGDTLNDALVPFIGSAAQTVQGTVTFDPALGFSTDGSSGRINAGILGKAGASDLWAYNRTAQAYDATGRCLIGTSSASDNYRIIGNRTPGLTAGNANGHVSNLMGNSSSTPAQYAGITSGGLTAAMWHSIRRSSSNTELVRNGVSVSLNTTAETAPGVDTTVNITVMGLNTATNSANSYLASGSRVSSYGVGDGTMTISEMATFRSLLQAFETSMGRQV